MEHKSAVSCELVSLIPSNILLIQMLLPVFLVLFNKLPTTKKKRQIVNETRTFLSLRSLHIRWIRESDKPTTKLLFTDGVYNFQYHFQNTKVVGRTGHTLKRTREKKCGIAALSIDQCLRSVV